MMPNLDIMFQALVFWVFYPFFAKTMNIIIFYKKHIAIIAYM